MSPSASDYHRLEAERDAALDRLVAAKQEQGWLRRYGHQREVERDRLRKAIIAALPELETSRSVATMRPIELLREALTQNGDSDA